MNNNDLILLDTVLSESHQSQAPGKKSEEFFYLFVAEQALKDMNLSYEELEAGPAPQRRFVSLTNCNAKPNAVLLAALSYCGQRQLPRTGVGRKHQFHNAAVRARRRVGRMDKPCGYAL